MDGLLQDIRFALRMPLRRPGFAIVGVLTLALGIGANTTIFTLVNAILLHALPVQDASRLVDLFTTDQKNKIGNFALLPTSLLNYQDYEKQSDVFSGMAAFSNVPLTLTGRGEPKQLQGFLTTAGYFDVLGVKPVVGRTFLPEEEKPGHPVVVVSYSLWVREFGGDPSFIGQTITLNQTPVTVIGVAPAGFKGSFLLGPPDEFWLPLGMYREVTAGVFAQFLENRRGLLMNPFGRLKPGVTQVQAETELAAIATRLRKEYPVENEGRGIAVRPMSEGAIGINFRGQAVMAGGMMFVVTGFVLVIACLNLANLLLARAAAREKEMSIRTALGAGRWRVVRQLLTESVMLALAGGALGLVVAYVSRGVLWAYRPPFLDANAVALSLDARVFAFAFGVSVLTGVLFGLVPALRSSRVDINESLKVGGRQGRAWKGSLLRNCLVVAEIALALVALVGGGLFIRSMQQAQQSDPGFESKRLASMFFDVGSQRYTPEQGKQFYKEAVERARTIPGVESATLSSNPPFGGGFLRSIFPEGTEHDPARRGVLVTTNMISPNYFETLRIPLLKGRVPTEFDTETTTAVAVVNQAMAKRFWPGEEAIGKRFTFFQDPVMREVVGVVATTVVNAIGEDPQPQVFLPTTQYYQTFGSLEFRTAGDPSTVLGTVRTAVQQINPNMPIQFVQTIEETMGQGLWAPRMGAALLSIFGLLSLVLAAIGVYGVMSYTVTQRTQEFGIRMTLGAQPSAVLRLVVREGILLAVIGLAIGAAVAVPLARLIVSLLIGVNPLDPLTFGGVSALLATVAILACCIPALRATRVDPLIALRHE